MDEITSKRQLRRLVVLPYDLIVKEVFAENVRVVTEFAKKTGDYPSLSATDLKVMALTYQLEKEHVGTEHLRTEPIVQKQINIYTKSNKEIDVNPDVTGFHLPGKKTTELTVKETDDLEEIEGINFKVILFNKVTFNLVIARCKF